MIDLTGPTRRGALAYGVGGVALALAPSLAHAQSAPAGKVDEKELMAGDALPDIVLGKADAPITIVEYASMTCGHCATFHIETLPELKTKYLDTGKAKFMLREFPLDPLAAAAFMLARCQGDKREAVVDLLFKQQKNWAYTDKPLEGLQATLRQTGMGADAFNKCLEDKDLYQNVLKVHRRAADKFAITSTPTFFINGERRIGTITFADLDKILSGIADKK